MHCTLRSVETPVGPAGCASSRSARLLKRASVTVNGSLVSEPNEPRSTVAVTMKLLALLHSAEVRTAIALPVTVTHEGSLV